MAVTLATLFPDWPLQAGRLRDAVVQLDADRLALRAGTDQDPIWALAAHTAGARVYWLCGVFGVSGAEDTPFTDPLSGEGWEDDPHHPRSAAELAWALDSSFAVVEDVLARWSVDELPQTAERRVGGLVRIHTRASVLNRLFTHDAFHAGEISQLLGMHHAGSIDLWAPPSTAGRLAP